MKVTSSAIALRSRGALPCGFCEWHGISGLGCVGFRSWHEMVLALSLLASGSAYMAGVPVGLRFALGEKNPKFRFAGRRAGTAVASAQSVRSGVWSSPAAQSGLIIFLGPSGASHQRPRLAFVVGRCALASCSGEFSAASLDWIERIAAADIAFICGAPGRDIWLDLSSAEKVIFEAIFS
ncbi:hypothetical protein NL676_034278 [Syzygium grande]|nr:hypothetical protein NL676_034278 [Syzygium grande]